ncbi:MAG: methionyl-tRNA formyltransferase [Candidatus Saccharibacteria bacterium]|nr:methionyl-tRNA formyltransferase [Rhodoferax sp.]
MKVVFAGTPEFARIALERLHASGHSIALVLTQPDRPAGRGMKLNPSAVKEFALQHGLPMAQPRSLRLDGKYPEDAAIARQTLVEANADVMVVAAYGLILPQWVLDDMAPALPASRGFLPPEGALAPKGGPSALPQQRFGCLNIHGSLLPRWRGAAPIHRAIEAGDTETGVTIMQMDVGLDTGDMLLTHTVRISDTATTGSLHNELANLGADLVVQALDLAAAGRLNPKRQPEEGVTYAYKIDKREAAIDWNQDAASIVRRVRAFNPFPVATTTLHGEVFKVWGATISPELHTATLGQIVAINRAHIAVAAMNSVVNITELQRPGGKRLPVVEFLRGYALQVGLVLA